MHVIESHQHWEHPRNASPTSCRTRTRAIIHNSKNPDLYSANPKPQLHNTLPLEILAHHVLHSPVSPTIWDPHLEATNQAAQVAGQALVVYGTHAGRLLLTLVTSGLRSDRETGVCSEHGDEQVRNGGVEREVQVGLKRKSRWSDWCRTGRKDEEAIDCCHPQVSNFRKTLSLID